MAGGEWSNDHFRVILSKWNWGKTPWCPCLKKGENQKVED